MPGFDLKCKLMLVEILIFFTQNNGIWIFCPIFYLGFTFIYACVFELSDPRSVTGFFKRKNNWIFSLFTLGIPVGTWKNRNRIYANSLTPNNVGLNPVH